MKTIAKLMTTLPIVALVIAGCDKVEAPNGGVELSSEITTINQPLQFSYDGNGDNIVFYSGEKGHEYKHKDRHELDGVLAVQFNHRNYNNDPINDRGWMYLHYSLDYDKELDNFQTATWVDITNKFNLSLENGWAHSGSFKNTGSISLPEINGEKVTFAFQCVSKLGKQPRWRWNSFKVDSYVDTIDKKVSKGTYHPLTAAAWAEYTILSKNGDDVWEADGQGFQFWGDDKKGTDGKGGTNTITTESEFAPEDDWLIFPTIKTDKTIYEGDSGIVTKTLSSNDTSWAYTYTKPGTYQASIVVSSYDSKKGESHQKVIHKTITVE